MLATTSIPNLVYQNVHGVERTNEGNYYNTMFLDIVNERWARDIDQMDMIIISTGRWFLLPSIYYENDLVIGSLNCPKLNHTQMDFYGPLRKALRTTFNSIIERKVGKGNGVDVILKTFSPDHFEGDWDKAGTCSKTKPYRKEEKVLGGMESEIIKIEIEEMERAMAKAKQFEGIKFEVLDVTKLALLRPDGHPGPYMNPFPFANGVPKYVQNDCVHWCLPGPIDTWNEILLEMMKKWESHLQRKE
ncbi:hypothetical protein P8452_47278 [Trifolium repens]|nr:hypothetical protein P8452_47278 [Trifolium repens]